MFTTTHIEQNGYCPTHGKYVFSFRIIPYNDLIITADNTIQNAKDQNRLQIALLDALYLLNEEQLIHHANIQLARENQISET